MFFAYLHSKLANNLSNGVPPHFHSENKLPKN